MARPRGIRRLIAALLTVALSIGPATSGQAQLFLLLRGARMMAKGNKAGNKPPAAPTAQTISYGSDPAQVLDFRPAQDSHGATSKPAPLIIFVHGGGWSRGTKDNGTGQWKAVHYPQDGIHFASINYRLVPQARVEDEAADVAHALAALLSRAGELGIDRSRVVLMGHSAGAHLVALVGTDPAYLAAAGLSLADIAGIIPIDGAAYNVPEQMTAAGSFMTERYTQAFGTDANRQRALSPTLHAGDSPNHPAFLLLHVQREDGIRQTAQLGEALRKAGARVQINSFDGTGLAGHMTINRRLGDPAYPATPMVDAWLKHLWNGAK